MVEKLGWAQKDQYIPKLRQRISRSGLSPDFLYESEYIDKLEQVVDKVWHKYAGREDWSKFEDDLFFTALQDLDLLDEYAGY